MFEAQLLINLTNQFIGDNTKIGKKIVVAGDGQRYVLPLYTTYYNGNTENSFFGICKPTSVEIDVVKNRFNVNSYKFDSTKPSPYYCAYSDMIRTLIRSSNYLDIINSGNYYIKAGTQNNSTKLYDHYGLPHIRGISLIRTGEKGRAITCCYRSNKEKNTLRYVGQFNSVKAIDVINVIKHIIQTAPKEWIESRQIPNEYLS